MPGLTMKSNSGIHKLAFCLSDYCRSIGAECIRKDTLVFHNRHIGESTGSGSGGTTPFSPPVASEPGNGMAFGWLLLWWLCWVWWLCCRAKSSELDSFDFFSFFSFLSFFSFFTFLSKWRV